MDRVADSPKVEVLTPPQSAKKFKIARPPLNLQKKTQEIWNQKLRTPEIESGSDAWEATILPLYQVRTTSTQQQGSSVDQESAPTRTPQAKPHGPNQLRLHAFTVY